MQSNERTVPPDHDNRINPYGALWIDTYRAGLKGSQTWIVATSNVGIVNEGLWGGHLCIGNSIAMGPNEGDLYISPFGADAVHIEMIDIQR